MLLMDAGGLEWDEVETIIIEKLGGIEDLEVRSKACSQDTPPTPHSLPFSLLTTCDA